MLLIFQIAGGILVAVLVLAFWRVVLILGAVAFVLLAAAVLIPLAMSGDDVASKIVGGVLGLGMCIGFICAQHWAEIRWRDNADEVSQEQPAPIEFTAPPVYDDTLSGGLRGLRRR